MESEIWKDVVGYESNYQVSIHGNVRAKERHQEMKGRWGTAVCNFPARPLKICRTQAGYCYLSLSLNGVPVKHLVHRLVLAAFVGVSELQCNHKDGDKSNNRLDNLEYCTSQENLRHCIDVLKKKRGEALKHIKLNDAAVRAIRDDQRILKDIAADHGVSIQTIYAVKHRKAWAHVAD